MNFYQKNNPYSINNLINNLSDLYKGEPIVHLEHGVGRYDGMTVLDTGGVKGEYLVLTYADNDKLYVPVSSLHLINRYVSCTNENVPLHKLGGDTWVITRKKAVERAQDMAAELLDIYAQRSFKTGFAFTFNAEKYKLFCEGFPFKVTVDQNQAINAVLDDMCKPLAMNRLVCGDVGFGKTEVAMRAAFLATENHKQVAVLVPTTLLAQQHFDNFRDRFVNWPVRIEMISRFCSVKDQDQILKFTSEGKINILIGTHKLLRNNVKWKNLGLCIIDEEHRFGVRHKERIKAICNNIDILTLTATPIPRTLNMVMNGMRDLSIICTPPACRLAVKTFVREYDSRMVRKAILREIFRGGQVYYLYNNVKNIKKIARRLETLVPEARIAIGHGQLKKCDLERVMNDFYNKHFNVLVCSTIIETGIDISNVNTIIIEHADRFGLAQLHQLRGRVGRAHHQAYAYLLTPSKKEISQDRQNRLEVISSLENLGAGFSLAARDLEIRGAGDLLGENQSGQMEAVGFYLYMELLERAVDDLKSGRKPSLEDLTGKLTEIKLNIPALLTEDYIPDVNMRLSLYKRIAVAKSDYEIEDLKVEIISQFGQFPDPVRYLLKIAHLKLRAKRLGIKRIEGNNKGGFIEFSKNNRIDTSFIISLITHEKSNYRLDGPTRLKFIFNLEDRIVRLNYVDMLLSELQKHTLNI